MVVLGEHFHWLRGHPKTAARRLDSVRRNRQRLQRDSVRHGKDAERG